MVTHIAITIPNSTETIGAYAFMHNNMKAITTVHENPLTI